MKKPSTDFPQNKRRCGPLETLGASDGFFIIVGEKSNPINGDKERESERVEAENGAFNVPLRVESSRARLNCYPILEERCCATARSRKKEKILLFSYSRENKNHCLPWKYKSCYEKYIFQKLERNVYTRFRGAKWNDMKTRNSKYISLARRIIVVVIL